MRYLLTAAAVVALTNLPANARAQDIKQVTVPCDIKNEDKEKPGSFKVQLKKDGKTVYERSGWGLEEGWDDNTNDQTSSGDLTLAAIKSKGRYTLVIDIDNGKRIDVDCEWYAEIDGTDGKMRVSSKHRKFFRNR